MISPENETNDPETAEAKPEVRQVLDERVMGHRAGRPLTIAFHLTTAKRRNGCRRGIVTASSTVDHRD